ncbi:MAG: LysR family transcriptional regulator [Moraxellaceae bacterium]|nr:LysR family transcriptional regulator [Moraxellaceae bacterium]
MKALQDLDIFVRTVESGSLSATARALDLTPAAASASLKRLEAELQTPLFVRSTRSLRLTPAGERFLDHCRIALTALRDGQEELATGRRAVRGSLQVAAPSDFGRHVLLPWLDEFRLLYPEVRFRLMLSDRMADVYREPVDIALRYGEPPDSSLVALPLATRNRRVLCASPAYLAKRGAPTDPRELVEPDRYECLCFMFGDEVHDRWNFMRGAEHISVRVRASQVANDGHVVRHWAIAGQGVTYKSALDVAGDLAAGRLVALCPEWETEPTPLYLVSPDRRLLSPAVGLLRDFIAARCANLLDSLPAAQQ